MPMRLARTLALLVIPCLAATVACDDEKKVADTGPADVGQPAETKTEANANANAGSCNEAHAKEIGAEMLSWCALSDKGISPEVPLAPWKPAPADKPTDGRVELRPGGLQVGWGTEIGTGELVDRLKVERERVAMQGRTMDGWSMTIGAETPRAEVAAVFRALAEGEMRTGTVVLSVEPPGPIPQPRDAERLAAIDAKVSGADPSQRAVIMARELEGAMPKCPAMIEAFSVVANASAEQRCALLARALSEGIVSCGCPDEDEILTLVYGASLGTKPPERLATTVAVTLDPAAPPRAGGTWGEIVAGLDEAATKALWVD